MLAVNKLKTMLRMLKALAALADELGSVPSTHKEAHNCSQLWF